MEARRDSGPNQGKTSHPQLLKHPRTQKVYESLANQPPGEILKNVLPPESLFLSQSFQSFEGLCQSVTHPVLVLTLRVPGWEAIGGNLSECLRKSPLITRRSTACHPSPFGHSWQRIVTTTGLIHPSEHRLPGQGKTESPARHTMTSSHPHPRSTHKY